MIKRIADASPRLKARIAGVFFWLLLLTAAFTEFFVRGRLSFAAELSADLAASLIEILCMIAVTLLFYDIFKPVNRSLSLLAASFNFVGLIFEVLQFLPRGANIGLAFHGFYWILIGYLIFRSTFLPRISGRADGHRGFVLADLDVTGTRKLSVPLRSGLRPPRGRIGDAVAPRDGRERSTMEGAGQRSRGTPINARCLFQIRPTGCCPKITDVFESVPRT
jgi:hypothetical protein